MNYIFWINYYFYS